MTNNYSNHPVTVTTKGAGGWKNFRWTIANAYFGNRQNNGADFRINISTGKVVGIRRASVFLPEEQNPATVAGAPKLEFTGNTIMWNAADDAVGWRLFRSTTLNPANWQEVTAGLTFTSGKVQYGPPMMLPAGFYCLQRTQRK